MGAAARRREVTAGEPALGAWGPVLGDAARLAAGAVGIADGAVLHLGDPEVETNALAVGGPVIVPLARHGALRVTGADRLDFVNGLVSRDVRALDRLGAVGALLLDHRGRPEADVTIVRREEDLYLAVDDGRAARVGEVLTRHVVFDQVEIEDLTGRIVSLVVSGRDVGALVAAALGAPDATIADVLASGPRGPSAAVELAGETVLLHARRRSSHPSLDLHARATALGALVSALRRAGATVVGEAALAAARIDAGIASSAFEGDDALPQEAGLDDRVSYRKGCYLGQEIMARIEARGTLRRGPVRLTLAGEPADPSDRAVTDGDGRTVGRVGTAALTSHGGWRALAVVRLDVGEGAGLRTLGVAARNDGAPSGPA